jgi:hypothetical protein
MLPEGRVRRDGDLAVGDAADEALGELGRRHLIQPGAHLVQAEECHRVGVDLAVEHPGAGLRVLQRRRQEVVHLQHFDAPLAHQLAEVVVLGLGFVDPQNVVEEQVVAIIGREPEVGQSRPAHHDLAQSSDL